MLADYVVRVLAPFATERDRWEERTPPTPGIPPTYSLVDLGRGEERRYRVFYESAPVSAADDPSPVLDFFFWHVNSEAIRHTGDFFLVHAGALTTPSGEGVLLPAPSGSGKSTLVAGLVRAGFGYLSDEAGPIDPVTRRLYPYPRALTLKAAVFDLFSDLNPDSPDLKPDSSLATSQWHVPPDAIRPLAVARPCEVRWVIIPTYQGGAGTELTHISRGNAALELGRNAMNLSVYGERALPLLSDLVLRAACYRFVYGNLAEAVEALSKLTSSGAPDQVEKTPSSLEDKSPT